VPSSEVAKVLDAFSELAARAIADLGTVKLKRIGTLWAEWRDGRVIRSPRDRHEMFLDGRHQLSFKPADGIKRGLAALSPQLWRDEAHQSAWRLARTLVAELEQGRRGVTLGVPSSAGDAEVLAACERIFPDRWPEAVRAWETAVPEPVRKARNHLAWCARQRWARTSRRAR